MKIEHISFGGTAVVLNTDSILPKTRDFFKPLQAGNITHKIDHTPFTCKITVENSIAIFDLYVGNNLLCTNFCCFAKEDKEPVLLYAKEITKKINPTAILTVPKEDHFFVTVLINPLAVSPFDLPLAGEIELYIYDAIYLGIKKRTSSSQQSKTQTVSQNPGIQKFEVNKSFPWEKYRNLNEATVPVFNQRSFDVVVSFIAPTVKEVEIFRKGTLEIGLFIYKDIPFLYLDFRQYSIDFALNINKLERLEDIDNWLNSKANVIHLYLVDGETGILKAQRMIAVNFFEEIRDALELQTAQTANETDEIIQELSSIYTTEEIQQKAIKRMIF